MAVFNKFNLFTQHLMRGEINLNTDTIKVMLTNTAPVAANNVYGDISGTQLANGNGYTTGGATVTGTNTANATGTETFAALPTTFTSVTGNMGPFRYVVYYDSSSTTKALIGWFDYGSSITLNGAAAELFVATPSGGALATLV